MVRPAERRMAQLISAAGLAAAVVAVLVYAMRQPGGEPATPARAGSPPKAPPLAAAPPASPASPSLADGPTAPPTPSPSPAPTPTPAPDIVYLGGLVLDDTSGEPVSGAALDLETQYAATSGADGRFLFEGIPPEMQGRLTVTHPDYQRWWSDAVMPREHAIDVRLERRTELELLFVDEDGQRVSGVQIARLAPEAAAPLVSLRSSNDIDIQPAGYNERWSDGRLFADVRAPWALAFDRASGLSAPLALPADHPIPREWTVTLRPQRTIEGIAVDADGAPLAGRQVLITYHCEGVPSALSMIGEDGRFAADLYWAAGNFAVGTGDEFQALADFSATGDYNGVELVLETAP